MDEGEAGCLLPSPPSLLRQIHHIVKKKSASVSDIKVRKLGISVKNQRIFITDPPDNVLGDIHQTHNSVVIVILRAESFYGCLNGRTHKNK